MVRQGTLTPSSAGSSPAIPASQSSDQRSVWITDAPLAQSVEHLPFKQGVRGSNPRRGTKKKHHPQGGASFWRKTGFENELRFSARRGKTGSSVPVARCNRENRIPSNGRPPRWGGRLTESGVRIPHGSGERADTTRRVVGQYYKNNAFHDIKRVIIVYAKKGTHIVSTIPKEDQHG